MEAKNASSGAFDGIRLVSAFLVLFSHCYVLTGQSDAEPLVRLTQGSVSFGEVAVFVFFAISGFLVTQSWFRDPSIIRFLLRRAVRIIPGLAFVIISSSFIVGAAMTALSFPEYYSNGVTWHYLTKIFLYPTQYSLPGVFEKNPVPFVVNGSLWSLRLEFALYVLVVFLGASGFLRWRWLNIALAFACLGGQVVLTHLVCLTVCPLLTNFPFFLLTPPPFLLALLWP